MRLAATRPGRACARLALAMAAALTLAGCYPVTGEHAYCQLSRDDPALPVERAKNVPMMRIGSLPHPFGPIPVNYGNPSPNALGDHSIRHSAFRSVRLGEQSAGIIYTQCVGFIDLAHTRNAADLTWHSYQRIRPALAENRPRVLLAGAEPTLFLLHLDYPPGWHGLDPAARDALADGLAVLLAVRMGYIISTWHEVLTTFGFKGVPGIPEHQSAFMYDDQPSHLVGAVAAGRAIERMPAYGETWNQAMTAVLADYLVEIGALDKAGSRRAVVACRGEWWGTDDRTRRHVHLGMAGEPFHPMLIHPDHPDILPPEVGASARVSNAAVSTDAAPVSIGPKPDNPFPPLVWHVPEPADLLPRWFPADGLLPAVRITLDPNVRAAKQLYEITGQPGPWLDLDTHGPALKTYLLNRFNN